MCFFKKLHNVVKILYNIVEVSDMNERNLNEELADLKKRNKLNNKIIAIQLIVLLFVCIIAIYVRIA